MAKQRPWWIGALILIGLGILIGSAKHGGSDPLAVIDPFSCCQLVRMGHEKRLFVVIGFPRNRQ